MQCIEKGGKRPSDVALVLGDRWTRRMCLWSREACIRDRSYLKRISSSVLQTAIPAAIPAFMHSGVLRDHNGSLRTCRSQGTTTRGLRQYAQIEHSQLSSFDISINQEDLKCQFLDKSPQAKAYPLTRLCRRSHFSAYEGLSHSEIHPSS